MNKCYSGSRPTAHVGLGHVGYNGTGHGGSYGTGHGGCNGTGHGESYGNGHGGHDGHASRSPHLGHTAWCHVAFVVPAGPAGPAGLAGYAVHAVLVVASDNAGRGLWWPITPAAGVQWLTRALSCGARLSK